LAAIAVPLRDTFCRGQASLLQDKESFIWNIRPSRRSAL